MYMIYGNAKHEIVRFIILVFDLTSTNTSGLCIDKWFTSYVSAMSHKIILVVKKNKRSHKVIQCGHDKSLNL